MGELCVLSASPLAASEIALVCALPLNSLIHSKHPGPVQVRCPVEWMLPAPIGASPQPGSWPGLPVGSMTFPRSLTLALVTKVNKRLFTLLQMPGWLERHSEETRTTLYIHSVFNRGRISHHGFHMPSAVTWYHVPGPYKKCICSLAFSLLL